MAAARLLIIKSIICKSLVWLHQVTVNTDVFFQQEFVYKFCFSIVETDYVATIIHPSLSHPERVA